MIVGRTMWTQSTSVTDGQTDRQTYGQNGRARAWPRFLLGTLSTRIANLLCMTLVKATTSGFPNALVFCKKVRLPTRLGCLY